MTDRRTDRQTDRQTERRNYDSICALTAYAVARNDANVRQLELIPSETDTRAVLHQDKIRGQRRFKKRANLHGAAGLYFDIYRRFIVENKKFSNVNVIHRTLQNQCPGSTK